MTKVSVFGLWHLGSVTAACLAEHFPVVGIDPDQERVSALNNGHAPVFEPGLDDLIREGLRSGRLQFTSNPGAVAHCNVVWVAFDTPVDDEDKADFEAVERQIATLFSHLSTGSVVIISSQVPAGFTNRVAARFQAEYPHVDVGFAYSPENLRLGQAIGVFQHQDRIVVGVAREQDRVAIAPLLSLFSDQLLWMSIPSAEMTKHALNAFLATSVSFINEVAVLCEMVGADCREVEHGLKSESRIGPKAYLRAGGAFAGGTLARDVHFLSSIGRQHGFESRLLEAVSASNEQHRGWAAHRLEQELGSVRNRSITVLGLTYKPGTDTLRRSASIELCRWLVQQGALVRVYDPKARVLPEDLGGRVMIATSAVEAARNADATVIGTGWPEFREWAAQIVAVMTTPLILDAAGFLEESLSATAPVRYVTVGRPLTKASAAE
jgi:UDPglucose 6-dehydrogenase